MKKLLYILPFLITLACTSTKHPAAVQLSVIDNGQSIQFKGLDYVVMQDIARDSDKNVWQNLVPVYRMPADTDLKNYQPVQPGRYRLKDSAVVFTPDTPFVKGQIYFARNYRLGEGATLMDYIKGHSQPGKVHFIDLIFKQ
ncbi:succinylglutamate desuccinylase [Mucilaginibacter sp. UYNi724]